MRNRNQNAMLPQIARCVNCSTMQHTFTAWLAQNEAQLTMSQSAHWNGNANIIRTRLSHLHMSMLTSLIQLWHKQLRRRTENNNINCWQVTGIHVNFMWTLSMYSIPMTDKQKWNKNLNQQHTSEALLQMILLTWLLNRHLLCTPCCLETDIHQQFHWERQHLK